MLRMIVHLQMTNLNRSFLTPLYPFIQAGHYTKHMLYLAAGCFAVTVVLLILIPSYGIGLLAVTGALLLCCNAIFYILYPR